MSRPPVITIAGTGAVSTAGWGVPALMQAIAANIPLPTESLPPANSQQGHPQNTTPFTVRRVPKPTERPAFLAHPRLRRSSQISQFAAAAALEAMGPNHETLPARRTGVIYTLLNGCVSYSGRFFAEVLKDPASASPILFPETVFNAPASHLATLLGFDGPAFTLIGDSAQFISGLEMAVRWILDDVVDACMVVGAEEVDPLTAAALQTLAPGAILTEGAGALLLERNGPGPLIQEIAGPIPINGLTSRSARTTAAQLLRQSLLTALPPDTLLIDDASGCRRSDAPGLAAWSGWTAPRLSPKRLTGEAPGASTALQCVLAASLLTEKSFPCAIASSIGADQQASALVLMPGNK